MPLLTPRHRSSLPFYQYKGGDTSLIYKYVLSPLAQYVAEITPTWVAPNLITLTGLLFSVFSSVLTLIYNPTLEANGPRWLSLVTGLCIFLYQTLDNVDGKQARRTGSSSPLGMLFDHGCDAINAGVCAISISSVFGTGWTLGIFFELWCGMVPFYFQTWEEFYMGEMHLPVINGPTEGLLVACFSCVISYVYGAEWWHLPISPESVIGKPILDILSTFIYYGDVIMNKMSPFVEQTLFISLKKRMARHAAALPA